jgi:integrase/recombinase XerD
VENTLKSYRSTLNVLREFAPKATFGDLTYPFIQKFDVYMSQERGNSLNGRWGRHKCLRTVIREAIKKKLLKEDMNPYKNGFFIKSAPSKRQPLTIAEINEIKSVEIPEKNGFLNRVRDIFLLSCYTGLRYSDVMRLSFGHIKGDPDLIVMEMQKTKKQVTIPLLPDAKVILDKYSKHKIKTTGVTIMPQMTNQVLNRELKVLIGKTSITKHVTFHIARHAFATSLVQSNVNLVLIRDLLGHTSIAQTQTYAKSVQNDLVNTMEKLASMYDQAV